MPARDTWTDERLDDLSKRTDAGFREVREEIRGLRGEMNEEFRVFRGEVRAEFARVDSRFDAMDSRFDALQRTLVQVGGGLAGAIFVGFMGLIATQL